MDDELMINNTPWWRNVNMAIIEEEKARRSSQPASRPVSRPNTPRPAAPSSAFAASNPEPSAPVTAPSSARPASDISSKSPSPNPVPTPELPSDSAPPVAPISYVPKRRDTLAPEDSIEDNEYPDIDNPSPPKWYTDISPDKVKKAARPPPGVDEHLNKIIQGIKNCVNAVGKGQQPTAAHLKNLNDGIHRAFFLDLSAMTIRVRRLLHNDTGLPKIFCQSFSGGVEYPLYIKEDAAELYTKWWSKDTDPDLFRGIQLGRTKNTRVGRESAVDKLDPKFKGRRHGNFFGNGHLRNGQWWPTQLCAVRDGAHNATVAGICGRTGQGAYSCVMSGGNYPNMDNGDQVWYYGTESDNPARPTDATQHLIENCKSQQPVRLLRASKMNTEGPNEYRPAEGMRYDGLYRVVDYEVKDLVKQVHLFHLVRLPDQGPIRYSGIEVRPTAEELEALSKAKIEKKYLA